MPPARSLLPLLAVAALVLLTLAVLKPSPSAGDRRGGPDADGARYRLPGATVRGDAVAGLPPPAPLRFAPAIAASDQQVVLDAVAGARPEARELIALVAGVVTIRVGDPGPGAAGQARTTAAGYDLVLDLGGVYRTTGLRGVRRLVLHELAHVVDAALVTSALEAQLDAATPPGFGCAGGDTGGCTAREERFAESFAKWATGDIGADLYIGYQVPPPRSLAGWGEPLAALTR